VLEATQRIVATALVAKVLSAFVPFCAQYIVTPEPLVIEKDDAELLNILIDWPAENTLGGTVTEPVVDITLP
jgi:hypothetical protein